MASDVNPVRCPACGNDFLQPFVCITCGAAKLYDATLLSAEARATAAERAHDYVLFRVRYIERGLEERGNKSDADGKRGAASICDLLRTTFPEAFKTEGGESDGK